MVSFAFHAKRSHNAGVEVTLIDANHCPGAAQILFKLSTGETYIHCGDMRFGTHLLENPHLQRFQNCNAIYLDTTYCNPKYTFPAQVRDPPALQHIAQCQPCRLTDTSCDRGIESLLDASLSMYLLLTYVWSLSAQISCRRRLSSTLLPRFISSKIRAMENADYFSSKHMSSARNTSSLR